MRGVYFALSGKSSKRIRLSFPVGALGFTAKGLGCISALSPRAGDARRRLSGGGQMRTRQWSICFRLAAALVMISGATFAHHGSAVSYNLSKMVTMEGTVTEFQWRN